MPRAAANQKTAVSQADNGAPNGVITGAKERFYYSFCPHESFRFVALDTFDLNAICGDGPEGVVDLASCSTGVRLLSEKNTNEDKSDFAGMDGLERRLGVLLSRRGFAELLALTNRNSPFLEASPFRTQSVFYTKISIKFKIQFQTG